MGLADAGAHCRVVCDGGTPTFMLTHWTRDRSPRPYSLPLEHVVPPSDPGRPPSSTGSGDRGALARTGADAPTST